MIAMETDENELEVECNGVGESCYKDLHSNSDFYMSAQVNDLLLNLGDFVRVAEEGADESIGQVLAIYHTLNDDFMYAEVRSFWTKRKLIEETTFKKLKST